MLIVPKIVLATALSTLGLYGLCFASFVLYGTIVFEASNDHKLHPVGSRTPKGAKGVKGVGEALVIIGQHVHRKQDYVSCSLLFGVPLKSHFIV